MGGERDGIWTDLLFLGGALRLCIRERNADRNRSFRGAQSVWEDAVQFSGIVADGVIRFSQTIGGSRCCTGSRVRRVRRLTHYIGR